MADFPSWAVKRLNAPLTWNVWRRLMSTCRKHMQTLHTGQTPPQPMNLSYNTYAACMLQRFGIAWLRPPDACKNLADLAVSLVTEYTTSHFTAPSTTPTQRSTKRKKRALHSCSEALSAIARELHAAQTSSEAALHPNALRHIQAAQQAARKAQLLIAKFRLKTKVKASSCKNLRPVHDSVAAAALRSRSRK